MSWDWMGAVVDEEPITQGQGPWDKGTEGYWKWCCRHRERYGKSHSWRLGLTVMTELFQCCYYR